MWFPPFMPSSYASFPEDGMSAGQAATDTESGELAEFRRTLASSATAATIDLSRSFDQLVALLQVLNGELTEPDSPSAPAGAAVVS
jgi:hypothetical protein